MARTPAKKASPKRKAAARKPARKPAARKAVRRMPAARKAQIRRQVARPRKGEHSGEEVQPLTVAAAPPPAPTDHLHANWGDTKEKSVTRMDKPTNWFRQAPKRPGK